MDLEHRCLKKIVRLALEEDRVDDDVTTLSLAGLDRPARAELRAKEAGVISGIEVFTLVLHEVDPQLEVAVFAGDGCEVKPGDLVLEVCGSERSILRGERTALNFLQRLSGVATLTRAFVEKLAPYRAVLLDTRKTTPGMRYLEKNAVRHGGGRNHRLNLEDMAMVKDNHIVMAGGIRAAVERVRAAFPQKAIEVEVKDIAELEEALALGVELVMLDNFPLALASTAVAINRGRARLEISGNVTLENIAEKAASGVDFISAGALTHSFRSLDLNLKIVGAK
ncbi:MAG: carboxylating nicotinate-nucleotide diphosphorylase [Acidobacteria bacterium]|jgi:nicotinate-nucleotide pyrophosphorylase (carboxylating)|nr:carboxylating nicotinate-nucleotide diphosphorylase [Acidobacteriota bacterium]